MAEQLQSLSHLTEQDLYFHQAFGTQTGFVIKELDSGHPLFCLRGRATLNRGQPLLRGSLSIVFHIPDSQLHLIVTPIHPSPFEKDTPEKFPSFFSCVMAVPPEFSLAAIRWIEQQKQIPARPEFHTAAIEDVRILPSNFFIGTYIK